MTEDGSEDAHSIEALGAEFNANYVGGVVLDELETIRKELNSALDFAAGLVPYLSGMYYTDSQRTIAEAHLFRITTDISHLSERLCNTLAIPADLHRPVPVSVMDN